MQSLQVLLVTTCRGAESKSEIAAEIFCKKVKADSKLATI
jgi:hypothetical protein